jgi:hypothetical protein
MDRERRVDWNCFNHIAIILNRTVHLNGAYSLSDQWRPSIVGGAGNGAWSFQRMPAVGPKPTCNERLKMSACWVILLKKSEYRLGPIFSAPWARFSDADAGPRHPPQTQRSEF